jgi:hypothetical protein
LGYHFFSSIFPYSCKKFKYHIPHLVVPFR